MPLLNLGAQPQHGGITIKRAARPRPAPTDPREFNSALAKRVWDRQHPQDSFDMSTLRLIPWNEIHRKLLILNPRMFFVPIGDGRIGIGVDRPSQGAIADYDSLSYAEKKAVDQYREIKGPRVLIICASENAVEPYTELVSASGIRYTEEKQEDGTRALVAVREPERVICRSLRTIIQACIEAQAFTWPEAERVFGMPFEKVPTKTRYLPMSPKQFHSRQSGSIIIGGAQ